MATSYAIHPFVIAIIGQKIGGDTIFHIITEQNGFRALTKYMEKIFEFGDAIPTVWAVAFNFHFITLLFKKSFN